MPSYNYKCDCGKEKEVTHSYKDLSVIICDCGKEMKRVFLSSATISFGDKLEEKKTGISKIYRELKETKKRFKSLKKDLERGEYK